MEQLSALLNRSSIKPLCLAIGMVSALALTGCSSDEEGSYSSDSGAGVSAPAPDQPKAADVKQPEPAPAPMPEPAPAPAAMPEPEPMPESAAPVADKVEEVKQEAQAAATEAVSAAKNGSSIYGTCVGCHGPNGEGGVGPKLAGQSKADIASKLAKYKAGEQMGAMTAMMAPMASGLSDDDIQAVADYISTL
ncbi:c-type cytochrome [Thiomicrorhabdus sp. ZW0627]|uniref:c-type cytochrome n=1 Tax=Thiomicrorhabdus sp. ZW0627 TaxID=3039774 RepID=UPI002436E41A|nr:c-type cytochrome [Thiomicrorhabdus sp. ZW0627]MDG6772817.1 c-type cytochrome [Thiomicrorhabdus sp. ZW0627]